MIEGSQVFLLSCKPLLYALILFSYLFQFNLSMCFRIWLFHRKWILRFKYDNGYQVLQFIAETLYILNKRMHCWKQQCLSFIDSKVNFYLGSFNYYMKFRILILKIAEFNQKKVMRYICYSVVKLQGAAVLWILINVNTLLTGSQLSQEALIWTLLLNNESEFEGISDLGWNKQTKKKKRCLQHASYCCI